MTTLARRLAVARGDEPSPVSSPQRRSRRIADRGLVDLERFALTPLAAEAE